MRIRTYAKGSTNFSLSHRSRPAPWVAQDDKLKFVGRFLWLLRKSYIFLRKEAMNDDPPRLADSSLVLLTAQEAADLLRVQRRSLYRFVQLQRIPYHRVGRAIRFERNELPAWTKHQSNKQGKES